MLESVVCRHDVTKTKYYRHMHLLLRTILLLLSKFMCYKFARIAVNCESGIFVYIVEMQNIFSNMHQIMHVFK